MGVVFLARDVLLERAVAIKLLAPALAAREEMRRRFLREARLAAQCFHPHIVPIHEVAESGELAWFVMAYVAGETLAERLQRVGTLPSATVQRIGREVGWALAYAHERGVVHRDVKPENILLEQGSDRALIADFGIAVATEGPHASGEVAGTARYMAPEQALGEAVDGRADLYALGVTLHFAATGRYPHDGNALALLAGHATRAPVRSHAPHLAGPLADAIDRCLALQPADRFADAAEFVAALAPEREQVVLPSEAREVLHGARATMTLADWTVAIAIASLGLVIGEEARSLGRALMLAVTQGLVGFAAAATALRAIDTLRITRRALREGASPVDVSTALAAPPVPSRPLAPIASVGLLMSGLGIAIGQAFVDDANLPSVIEAVANVATWVLPPVLIQRAMEGLRSASGLNTWWHLWVRRPIASRIVRWLGGRRQAEPVRPAPASGATEVLLQQAAATLFAELGVDAQRALAALPAATAALAQEAIALRARAAAIDAEQRVLRHRADDTPAEHRVRRDALQAERAAVDGRLGATVAALEAIRVDLLRLHADRTVPGSMTEQLDVVRELQRHVDAAAEVRRALQQPLSITPTPA